ncbi:MAG: DNA alkylation repair protein [Spartobacteria bacterium]|nr:DNA alkylation repair protein [Spartobacteria bacterium]
MTPSNPAIYSSRIEAAQALADQSTDKDVAVLERFFKTGPGEYGEGDRFIGVRVPKIRIVAKACVGMPLSDCAILLHSSIHEERMLALLTMVSMYKKGDEKQREAVYDLYMSHTRFINNWDLVDLSAPQIVGAHLWQRNRQVLRDRVRSRLLWDRRIAMLATFFFIKKNDFEDGFDLARRLIRDKESLIHKASGWMLREIGKRDLAILDRFLVAHYQTMPRTMLRYAIEKHPESIRQAYLKGLIHE